MATNLKVQGNHIQYILDNILGFEIGAVFTGNKGKQDEYKTYILSEGAITTNDDERINIHYYWDYRLTVKSNLFTFPIVGRFDVNDVMKVLTDEQQTTILTYLGCDITSDEEEAESECCGKHCDETEGLKLGMGWNRWHSSVKDMITDQLWCENCYKDCVGRECKSCSEYYPYTEMTYHKGGAFGEPCMDLAMFFCKSCVDKINSIDYNPDEYV
jgi:hypothetical protein